MADREDYAEPHELLSPYISRVIAGLILFAAFIVLACVSLYFRW